MSKSNKSSETLLGIDYGDKNIGLAFGREGLVSPVKVLSAKDPAQVINEISVFVINNKIDKIVMGLPLTYEEKDTPKARQIRLFAKKLKIYIKKPVEFVNEYRSTEEAFEIDTTFDIPTKGKKPVDHISAGIILKRYYAENNKV